MKTFEQIIYDTKKVESEFNVWTKLRERKLADIGAEVRAHRLAKGVSLRCLARRMGLTPPYISDLERGFRHFNAALLRRYRDALDFTPPVTPQTFPETRQP